MTSTEATVHSNLEPVSFDRLAGDSVTRFDQLVLGPEISRGGTATVYQAHDLRLGRTVAVKLLSRASALDRQAVKRFHRETHIAAALDHPHIVPVFAKGELDGAPYFEMPFIAGRSLNAVLSGLRNPACRGEPLTAEHLPSACHNPADNLNLAEGTVARLTSRTASLDYFREVATLVIQAATALAYAHEHGIVHCDVKPANILLDSDGRVWLIDFSAAHTEGEPATFGEVAAAGTLAYLPPEMLEDNAAPTPLCDVFGLGATLYELTTLRPPFAADNGQSLMRQIVFEVPLAPRRVNRHIPRELAAITQRAMSIQAEDRFTSMEEMRSALQRWFDLSQDSPPSRQRWNRFRGLRQATRIVSCAFVFVLLVLAMFVAGRGIHQSGTSARLHGDGGTGVGTSIPPTAPWLTSGEVSEITDQTMYTFGGHRYRLTSRPGSWEDAEHEAIAMGGHLVAISDQGEQDFLNATFLEKQSDGQDCVCWIGLHRAEASGEYRWSSGEVVNYTNWHPGEPNDFAGRERYAAANWHLATESIGDEKRGDWNDVPLQGFKAPIFGIIEISEKR